MARPNEYLAGNRGAAAIATLAVHLVLIAGVIWGLRTGYGQPQADDTSLESVTTFETPPPPPEPEPRTQAQDEPAPEGAQAEAVPVEAPPAAIVLAPAVAAPKAGDGQENRSGAGDTGSGPGAGGTGDGDGSGGIATPARRIAGALRDSDYPRTAEQANMAGTVAISFRVRTDGRVDRCTVRRSSGYALLDYLTCRLFTERFRFEPARTVTGRPVESTLETNFTWGTRRR